jgi:predicted lipoprotein with Yx(FWY)xxD motif
VKRIPFIAVIVVAGFAAAAALAATPTVKLQKSLLGKIVVTGRSFTAYAFTADKKNKDVCVKKNGCASTWPPVTTKTKLVAGPGLQRKLLGTIKLPNGSRQVTYAGHPLYRYAGDTGHAETDYVGQPQFGGTWYAVNAAGHYVK